MFTVEELLSIGRLCIKYGVIILSDEVYERLHYTPTFPRIATLDPEIAHHTVTIGSIGKAFNATGWRIGYVIGDMELIRHVQNAHIVLSFTTAGPAQLAAVAGMERAEGSLFWEENRRAVKKKLESLFDVFDELGLPVSLIYQYCFCDGQPCFDDAYTVRQATRSALRVVECEKNQDSTKACDAR